MIDTIYPYDTHDFGVLYVAESQMTADPSPEAAILGNTSGSLRYSNFLAGLGRLVSLKNRSDSRLNDTYLDGLDTTAACRDGKYTYHWKVSVLCFHSPLIIPPPPPFC